MLMGMIGPGSGASAWTPKTAGAAFWYDASDNSTVFTDNGVTQAGNGDLVQQWNDKANSPSPGRFLRQTNASFKPAYLTNTINGLNVVDVHWIPNVASAGMDTSASWTGTLAQPLFIIAAIKYHTPAQFEVFVDGDCAQAAAHRILFAARNTAGPVGVNLAQGALGQSTLMTDGNNYMIYGFASNGGTDQVKASGIAATTGSSGETAGFVNGLAIGFPSNGTPDFGTSTNQSIGEIFAFAVSGISDPNIAKAITYITTKWNVAA